jgi:hypothetical protein
MVRSIIGTSRAMRIAWRLYGPREGIRPPPGERAEARRGTGRSSPVSQRRFGWESRSSRDRVALLGTALFAATSPGRKPPFRAAKRPARPNKNATKRIFTVQNAKVA